MAIVVTISETQLRSYQTTEIIVDDDSLPGEVTISTIVKNSESVDMDRSFKLYPDGSVPGRFSRKIFGWQLGIFPSQDVNYTVFTDSPEIKIGTETMEVIAITDFYSPIEQYFLSWLANDPTLSGYASYYSTVRDPVEYLTQVPAYYSYIPSSSMKKRLQGRKYEYFFELFVTFVDDIEKMTNDNYADERFNTFVTLLTDHVAVNSQLNQALGVVTAIAEESETPFNLFENIHIAHTSVKINIHVIPFYEY